jgi:1-acyl-sn-glycerol-3-phosphate acyltransferase
VFDPENSYQIMGRVRLFRWLFRPVFRGIFRLLSRVEVSGLGNIPRHGAYLIAVNHVSLFEPPLVLAFWPAAPEAVGAVEIWERPGQAMLARMYGGIPVHRGSYDRRFVEMVIKALDSGRPLLIAPEGGRSHTLGMRRALPGVAYVIEKAKVPVVPVGIAGVDDDFLRRALRGERPVVTMRVGQPVNLPPIEGSGEIRRAALQRNADMVMLHIAALLPEEYHGIYARQSLPLLEAA